ncbi:AAA family ATPase [Micromonospora oryzae]|uniref:AAA family ATPase n=1 Tax=Micromonospora sp. DSM 102119 TaxID=3111768 RepID=UPI0031DE7052
MRSLRAVSVEALLGSFDHDVYFPPEWEFVIIHGPNGVGKTKLFELIRATFTSDIRRLGEIPFRQAHFLFDDESEIQIARQLVPFWESSHLGSLPVPDQAIDIDDEDLTLPKLYFRLLRPGYESVEWSQDAGLPNYQKLWDWYQHLRPTGRLVRPSMLETPEVVSLLTQTTGLSRSTKRSIAGITERQAPAEAVDFLGSINVHLIETQRLLYRPKPDEPEGSEDETQTRVSFLAADLVRRLREALAQSSEISQRRDSSFPRRLFLAGPVPKEIPNEYLIERYNEQTKLRDRLGAIGLTETYEEIPLPTDKLGSWQRRVLWTYLEDSEDKLHSFVDILRRVELFRNIINSRFLFKQMKIDRERGFVFETRAGEEISADKLSSGEQHELVMVYGLLFDVQPGSLVLIDEPEISLHPAWQRKFLDDIVHISALTSLRFMIATHSPQIIHKWWNRTVSLVASEDEYDENHGRA